MQNYFFLMRVQSHVFWWYPVKKFAKTRPKGKPIAMSSIWS